MPGRRTRAGALLGAVVMAACVAVVAPSPVHAEPVRVAVMGDSVTDALHLPALRRDGLAGALSAELRRRGHRITADGFRAAQPHPDLFRWTGAWRFEGYRFDPASPDGASGYTAVGQPGASAAATVRGDRVDVLYTRTPDGGTFPVTIDGRRHELDGHATRTRAARTTLRLPRRGRARVVVYAPPHRPLRFTGLLATSQRDEVAVLALGHGGRQAREDLAPRNRAALRQLQPDVSLLLYGIVEGLGIVWSSLDDPPGLLARGLQRRARAATATGGRCVVVPPTPSTLGPGPTGQVDRASRRAADAAGCALRPVLSQLWDVRRAMTTGLLMADGYHPTAPGYRRLARALADAVEAELD